MKSDLPPLEQRERKHLLLALQDIAKESSVLVHIMQYPIHHLRVEVLLFEAMNQLFE